MVAKRQRICKHNRTHIICRGDKCLIIYEGEMKRPYPYCWECASEILKNALKSVSDEMEEIV